MAVKNFTKLIYEPNASNSRGSNGAIKANENKKRKWCLVHIYTEIGATIGKQLM